jgi:hypothetical protein
MSSAAKVGLVFPGKKQLPNLMARDAIQKEQSSVGRRTYSVWLCNMHAIARTLESFGPLASRV